MEIHFKENYDSVLLQLENKHFFVFGTTKYANIFYLYCLEKHFAQNIDAFILSDIVKDKRKVHLLHNIPIKDIKWLEKRVQKYSIFIAAKEEVVQEQIIPLLHKTACGDIFYVSDFVHNVMYAHFMDFFFKDIIKKYVFSSDLLYRGITDISDIGSKNIYKYSHKIARGDPPDSEIFYGNMKLDDLHQMQLGDYFFIDEGYKRDSCNYKCKIYVAKSHVDKELKENFHTPFTVNIQVGASLTEQNIAEYKDNVGDNISIRNKDYCEMSAIYWVWKNDKDNDYVGVCHYRRRFAVNEGMINFIMENNFDVVYTLPTLTDGGMRKEFVERNYYLTPEDWKLTEEILLEFSPEYFDTWLEFEKSYFIIPCNMFIMKKDVFNKYCTWVFRILEEIDKHYIKRGIQCDNRYLGYISECLTTVYVMKNKNILKKGYVAMKFLENR